MSNLPNFPTIRPSLLLDFANSKQVDPRISFTRSSTATYFVANGVLRTAASGVPRIDHDPVTCECKGLLIEEVRTNLLTYSEQFDNAAWLKSNSTIAANAITAPDGTTTADKLVENTASSAHFLYQNPTLADNTVYCHSVFAKASERSHVAVLITDKSNAPYGRIFNLADGTSASPAGVINAPFAHGIQPVGNGWYLCWVAQSTGSGATQNNPRIHTSNGSAISYTGDGSSGLYIWGAQLEAGAFPTSYIPTTTAAATRAADVASMSGTNFSEWYRQDEGTFVVTASRASTGRAFTVSDGTANENMRVNLSAASPLRPDWQVIDNGTTQVATTSTPNVPLNSNFTVAAAYKKDDFAISVNGAAVVTDTGGTVPLVDRMHLGAQESGVATGGANFRRIVCYPKRLTNDELKALTA